MSSDTAHIDAFRIRDTAALGAGREDRHRLLPALTHAQIDGAAYDRELPERVKTTLY